MESSLNRKYNSGGSKAPRLANGNIDWIRVYNEYITNIIRNQKAPNTARGLMYILESKGVLKKSDYNTLVRHLVEWRLEGLIPWEAIADGSGRGIINDFDAWEGPESWVDGYIDMVKNAGKYYHENMMNQWKWFGQPKYVEYMAEKHTITGTIEAYTNDDWHVKISFNKGNNGWGNAYNYVKKLENELFYVDVETGETKPREEVHVKYLGDDDKYGRHMDKELRGQLKEFGILDKIHFERIAVLPHQIAEYGIPKQEGGGYEIDALNAYGPDLFEKLLIDNIAPYFDDDIHKKVLKLFSPKNINKMINNRINFTR